MSVHNSSPPSPFILHQARDIPSASVSQSSGSSFQFLLQRTQQFYGNYAPKSVKAAVQMTGNILSVSGRTAFIAFLCLEECLTGFKPIDPQSCIEESLKRLGRYDENFSACCHFMTHLAAQAFLNSEPLIEQTLKGAIQNYPSAYPFLGKEEQARNSVEGTPALNPLNGLKGYFFDWAGEWAAWFMQGNKELIAKTIQANLLNMLANLADQSDMSHLEESSFNNPFGSILAVLGECLQAYQKELNDLENNENAEEREAQIQGLFQRLSNELLIKCFPGKEKDIKLFHPTIPVVYFQGLIWQELEQKLPPFLCQLYKETKPLKASQFNGVAESDQALQIGSAGRLIKRPSFFVESATLSKLLNKIKPKLVSWIECQGVEPHKAQFLGDFFSKYLKELLLTDTPSLKMMGSFLERYFMERILFNVMQALQKEDQSVSLNGQIESSLPPFVKQANRLLTCLNENGQTDRTGKTLIFIRELLNICGLEQKESLPVPPIIQEAAWSFLKEFQTEKLPLFLTDMVIGQLDHLNPSIFADGNKAFLNEQNGSASLTNFIKSSAPILTEWVIEQMAALNFEQMSRSLPDLFWFNEDQKRELDCQFKLLFNDSHSGGQFIRRIAGEFLQGMAFEFLKNLSLNYQQAQRRGERPLPFFAWLVQQLAVGCRTLHPESWTEEKLRIFRQAVELNHEIHLSLNEEIKKQKQETLNHLWEQLQADFQPLSQQMLQLIGWHAADDMPVPRVLQAFIWNWIQKELPKKLFEQIGNLMLPEIEKRSTIQIIQAVQYGDQIIEGCHLLAQDVLTILPRWVGSFRYFAEEMNIQLYEGRLTAEQVSQLTQKIIELVRTSNVKVKSLFHACESLLPPHEAYTTDQQLALKTQFKKYKEQIWDIALTPEEIVEKLPVNFLNHDEQAWIADQIQHAVHCQQAYAPFWNFIESYLEGVLLKMAAKALQMDSPTKEAVQNLANETILALSGKTNEEAQPVLNHFIDNFFAILKIEPDAVTFGIPSIVKNKLLGLAKIQAAKLLLKIYHSYFHIGHFPLTNREDVSAIEGMSVPQIGDAVQSLTRYAIDQAVDQFMQQKNGHFPAIGPFYRLLGHFFEHLFRNRNLKTAGLLQTAIGEHLPTPFLESLLARLNQEATESSKQQAAEWINPLLTAKLLQVMIPFVDLEKTNPEIDHELVKGGLSVLLRHLKHLNQSIQEGGLTFQNFARVAGNGLHPHLLVEGVDEQRESNKTAFYDYQVKMLMRLIFPNGKRDLLALVPDLPETLLIDVWRGIKKILSYQLPSLVPRLFEEEALKEIVIKSYESLLGQVDFLTGEDSMPNLEEMNEDSPCPLEINALIGECLVESVKLIDPPFSWLDKLPVFLKELIGIKKIKAQVIESIGAAVQRRLNGQLIVNTLQEALPSLVQTRYVSLSDEEKAAAQQTALVRIQDLERQIIEKGIQSFIQLLGKQIDQACDIFPGPTARKIKTAILAAGSFVVIKCLGALLRFFKLDQFFINRLAGYLRQIREGIIEKMTCVDIHENLVFQEIQVVQSVLSRQATALQTQVIS
ncbi:hypothetical protein [Candidatus Protochlamydia phocaeensis]|uniref:hypothetical protein n=1 Tax=Candidatus Protochlamydia phocaeensis TaxID=1414722 RepID=UPI000838F8F7|nr:hypothetical protein [Candidatus Protochlamydia phocaeensis]